MITYGTEENTAKDTVMGINTQVTNKELTPKHPPPAQYQKSKQYNSFSAPCLIIKKANNTIKKMWAEELKETF